MISLHNVVFCRSPFDTSTSQRSKERDLQHGSSMPTLSWQWHGPGSSLPHLSWGDHQNDDARDTCELLGMKDGDPGMSMKYW